MFVNVYDYLIWELIDLTSLNCIMFHKTVITLRQSYQTEIATLIKKWLSTIIGALIRISVLKQNGWLTLYILCWKSKTILIFTVIEKIFLKMMDSNSFWELSFTTKPPCFSAEYFNSTSIYALDDMLNSSFSFFLR